jgi:hypothetical protein
MIDEVRSRVVRLTSVPRGDPRGRRDETPGVASLSLSQMTSKWSLPSCFFGGLVGGRALGRAWVY